MKIEKGLWIVNGICVVLLIVIILGMAKNNFERQNQSVIICVRYFHYSARDMT